jgi:hypothetical protein
MYASEKTKFFIPNNNGTHVTLTNNCNIHNKNKSVFSLYKNIPETPINGYINNHAVEKTTGGGWSGDSL